MAPTFDLSGNVRISNLDASSSFPVGFRVHNPVQSEGKFTHEPADPGKGQGCHIRIAKISFGDDSGVPAVEDRPQRRFSSGHNGRGKSRRCTCGFEAYPWQRACPKCRQPFTNRGSVEKEETSYVDEEVRIADLAAAKPTNLLEGYTFERCVISGPAVLLMDGRAEISFSDLGAEAEALLWEIPLGRTKITGAVVMIDCRFIHCTFVGIGFAQRAEWLDKLVRRPA